MAEEFGPYLLEEVIGRGGMGIVHRAFDTRRDRTVALKRLPRELAADENFQARFRRESRLAARLNEPHIIPIHDFGEIDGQLYLDMRLVEGLDLGKLITAEGGMLEPGLAVDIIAQVAAALTAAHTSGLMHRDIKPSNILITGITEQDRTSPFAYLVDFGIARAILGTEGTALTTTSDWFGTVAYMAPERISGSSGDNRSDIYSLACLLYQCVTGRPPFTGEALQVLFAHVNSARPSATAANSVVPAGLDAVIRRGMATNPDDRYQSATLFAAAAKSSVAGLGRSGTDTQVVPLATRPIQQRQPQAPTPAGPLQSMPARSGPPNSRPPVAGPPNSRPPVAGPPNSRPPVAGPPNSRPPVAGPPNSRPPVAGPPNSRPPVAGPPNSGPRPAGPPNSGPMPPRPPARPPGSNTNGRALVIMIAIAVIVVLAAAIAVIVAVNGNDSNASSDPTSSFPSPSGTDNGSASTSQSQSQSSSPSPTDTTAATWARYAEFSRLVGTAPGSTSSAFLGATCSVRPPDTIAGMADQIECIHAPSTKVIYTVARFTQKSSIDNYVAKLNTEKYDQNYWTVASQRRGLILVSPTTDKFADVTSTICGLPLFLVQFYAASDAKLTSEQVRDQYWKKSVFPDTTPPVCV